jgi:hypothetical protein
LNHGLYGGMENSYTPDRIGKRSNARRMVKYHVFQSSHQTPGKTLR